MNDFTHLIRSRIQDLPLFPSSPLMRMWWSIVMRLHGKPCVRPVDESMVKDVAANGFRFYARIYRVVAILLGLGAVFLLIADGWQDTLAGTAALTGAALFLLVITPLANHGAAKWGCNRRQAQIELIVFFTAITMFLTGFISVAAAIGICNCNLPGLATVLVCGALILFGVGSYALEIIYIVKEGSPS